VSSPRPAAEPRRTAVLLLSSGLAAELLDHARRELPNEACGLLSGSAADGVARVYHPARNAHASPYRYTVDPEDLVRITFAIERAGEELIAIVHSHPATGAEPSATDRRSAQLYPGTPQLIVSLAGEISLHRRLRAWRIGSGSADELPLRIG
jgi:proteasome lid subunit RPN8/RPN11